ncbi:glutamate--cysteine ligase [Streptomyces sp. NPDC056600]|uniref:glutamate--cysteine ligase 2 n=1 Tax=Streptomyces sp. NPDC056600 TaxID=3345874 RepID=UPI003699C1E8
MRTVGVEEELLLVDPETGDPRALSAAVLARAERDPADSDVFEKELHGQMLEFATHPQSSLAELQKEIVRWRADAARHAAGTGAAVTALATSPLPVSPKVSTSERYRWMVERYGLPTQEQMVCGCHVHVSVESDEEGVAVLDRIRNWLPVLTALSANSPFWQGKETGYRSYRRQVWERWPSAGPTEPFGTPEEYHRRTDAMVATGAILDRHMAYYDARLSDAYPTVEIRVSDVCMDADTPVLIAALARGLVETAATQWRSGAEPASPASVSLMKLAAWQASRSGLDGDLLHPLTFRPAPAREVVDALLEHLDEALGDTGDRDLAHRTVDRLFKEGNGARVQWEVWEKTGSLRDVVLESVRRTAAEPGAR